MMPGHGANPIFFNKKIKIGCPENSPTPHPLRSITSHFCLSPAPPPPPLNVDVICVSRLMVRSLKNNYFLVRTQLG